MFEYIDEWNIRQRVKFSTIKEIKTNHQCKITGKIYRLWDIPLSLRYTKHMIPKGRPKDTRRIGLQITATSEIIPRIYKRKNLENELREKLVGEYLWDKTDHWKRYMRYAINPYEMLQSPATYRPKNFDNSYLREAFPDVIHRPVSRAYWKIYEIVNFFGWTAEPGDLTVSLGDAPGGFAQALTHLFPKNKVVTVSLIDPEAIAYAPEVVKNRKVTIDGLVDGRGDLLSIENVKYFIKKYHNRVAMAGCDGALSYTALWEQGYHKEMQHTKLFLFEAICCLGSLKLGGHMTLKLYGNYTKVTVQIYYWFATFFAKMFVYKPRTLRISNKERFVVCVGLHTHPNITFIHTLLETIDKIPDGEFIDNLFNFTVPEEFLEKILSFTNSIEQVRNFTHLYGAELLMRNQGEPGQRG
ncbi:MAG: SAM-dependent methyltransferase, partial [Candidatus Heimdallarchaeota archaeon]|nr:SAM-dependent methyltransferase [Candidatus Heimdallarchaeota archaeon]